MAGADVRPRLAVFLVMAMMMLAGSAAAHGPYTVTLVALQNRAIVDARGLGAGSHNVQGCQTIVAEAPAAAQPLDIAACRYAEVDLSRDSAGLDDAAPLECGRQAVGTTHSDCSLHTQHHHHPFAAGTCQVLPLPSPRVGSDYDFLCGIDRNADGVVSDADVCREAYVDVPTRDGPVRTYLGGEDSTAYHGSVSNHDECTGEQSSGIDFDDHADDWVTGGSDADCPYLCQSRSFCFQDKVRGFTDDPADDTGRAGDDVSAANQAVSPVEHGDGWAGSGIQVFVSVYPVTAGSAFGGFEATVEVWGAFSCPWGIVSGHVTAGNTDTDGNGRDTPECSDSIDNLDGDSPYLIDEADPQCLRPDGSYDPSDNSENV